MKLLLSWIDEFAKSGLTADELAEKLTMAGIETSGITYLGDGLDKIISVRISGIEPHPNADRLKLCRVTDGKKEYPVVCGAPNIREGQIVPLALPGAILPGGLEIKQARIRGETSEGMLCSERELGVSDDHQGIMVLPGETLPGISIKKALFMDDYLLEVEITPNRGDCLSVIGVAREISAITGVPLIPPSVTYEVSDINAKSLATVRVEDYRLCPRYSAKIIYDVEIGPSPLLMRRRLELCGIRPINNIVDITNYILLELGQPMHAFDLDYLEEREIVVKLAGDVGSFTTLDGLERSVDPETLLIWDGNKPVAIAGIMGGLNSEVVDATKRVLFESAHFDPLSVRRSAKRLGLSTESSYRFERGVDPAGTMLAIDRALTLLGPFSGHKVCDGEIDEKREFESMRRVQFSPKMASELTGIDVTNEESTKIFRRLHFDVEDPGENILSVHVPSYRFDISREIDLVEELVRIKGYDQVPVTYPNACSPHLSPSHDLLLYRRKLIERIAALGFQEVINYTFISENILKQVNSYLGNEVAQPVAIENPISEDTRILRPSLIFGILKTIKRNISRYNRNLRIFEIGKVFRVGSDGSSMEEDRVGLAITGELYPDCPIGEGQLVDFAFLRSVVENILYGQKYDTLNLVNEQVPSLFLKGSSGSIKLHEKTIGYVGEVNQEVLNSFEINQPVLYADISLVSLFESARKTLMFKPLSKYPPVERDISFVTDISVPAGDIVEYVMRVDTEIIVNARIFDVYRSDKLGNNKKSVGLRIVYQSDNRTLTEQEVNDIHKKILALIENRFGGKIRSSQIQGG